MRVFIQELGDFLPGGVQIDWISRQMAEAGV